MFIIDDIKHLNFVYDGRNKYWLNVYAKELCCANKTC